MPTIPDIPRRLPRGTHGLDRGVVAASQPSRLLEAVGCRARVRGRDDRRPGATRGRFAERRSPELPFEICHAVIAAIDDVVVRHIREHGAERLPTLEPILLQLQVALLDGGP